MDNLNACYANSPSKQHTRARRQSTFFGSLFWRQWFTPLCVILFPTAVGAQSNTQIASTPAKSVCASYDGTKLSFTDPQTIIARIPNSKQSEFETNESYEKRITSPLDPDGKLYVVKTTSPNGIFQYNAESGEAEFDMSSFGVDPVNSSSADAAIFHSGRKILDLSFQAGQSYVLKKQVVKPATNGVVRNEKDLVLLLHDFVPNQNKLESDEMWPISYTVGEAKVLKKTAKAALVIKVDQKIAFNSTWLLPARVGVLVNNYYDYTVFTATVICGLMYTPDQKVAAYFEFREPPKP